MPTEIFSLDQLDAMFEIEHDWLFSKATREKYQLGSTSNIARIKNKVLKERKLLTQGI